MDAQTKTVTLRFRTTPFFEGIATRLAKEAGVNRSEFIRRVVLEEAKRRGLVRENGSKSLAAEEVRQK